MRLTLSQSTQARAACLLILAALAACGGGSITVDSTSTQTPELVTVPEYLALRSSVVQVTGGIAPGAVALAALTSANHQMAAEQMAVELAKPGGSALVGWGDLPNPVVAPPLTQALLRSLAAAANGATLAQIQSKFDIAPSPQVAAMQTGLVSSQWWADKGRRFRTVFLAAGDQLGPVPRLAAWAGAETGFADGGSTTDTALAAALDITLAGLAIGHLPNPLKNIRLAAMHALGNSLTWSGAIVFDGVFDRAVNAHDLVSTKLLRVSSGIKRFAGADYTADVLQSGSLRWAVLQPNAGSLSAFSATRLQAALAETALATRPGAAVLPAGEWVLPQTPMVMALNPEEPLQRAGVTLPFDEVNADFTNLDGRGGTYAIPQTFIPIQARWSPSSSGLEVKSAQVTVFMVSPKNIFGSAGSITGTIKLPPLCGGMLIWPTADARSFFLAVLDANGWVVQLVAMQAPPGPRVEPTCVP